MRLSLSFQPEVAAALADKRPIVALESTLITHGLPYPANVETALAMEAAVREGGATPATIAVIAGALCVGLTADQVAWLGQLSAEAVRKCSRRDLPVVVARREHGATTVAGTMIVAHMAGIELFATGGIGGVHRDHPFDVSADLLELGRTPVTVVCSGAKSILDLPATREVLETHGVPVIGYRVDEMPAFFSRRSGLPVDLRVETPDEVAALIAARRALGLPMGTLVGVPAPLEAALEGDAAENAIRQAVEEAEALGVYGPAATPWLLRRVAELTGGASLEANTALLHHNANVAGQIAAALARHTATD